MSPNDGRRKADVGAASMTGLHGSQKRRRTCLSAGRFDLRRPSLAGLVVIAGSLNPIPSRTRPLNSLAPMVLSLKAWKSRSLPGLPRTSILLITIDANERPSRTAAAQGPFIVARGRRGPLSRGGVPRATPVRCAQHGAATRIYVQLVWAERRPERILLGLVRHCEAPQGGDEAIQRRQNRP